MPSSHRHTHYIVQSKNRFLQVCINFASLYTSCKALNFNLGFRMWNKSIAIIFKQLNMK